MAKPNLLKERIIYKPFEYPKAFDYWLKQQQAHWIHTEVPMISDINDWKQNLNKTERNIILIFFGNWFNKCIIIVNKNTSIAL